MDLEAELAAFDAEIADVDSNDSRPLVGFVSAKPKLNKDDLVKQQKVTANQTKRKRDDQAFPTVPLPPDMANSSENSEPSKKVPKIISAQPMAPEPEEDEPLIAPLDEDIAAAHRLEGQAQVKAQMKAPLDKKLFLRKAAGKIWKDDSLMEWPDGDHRIFCGDLGNEVNDNTLAKVFVKYSSFAKAKVVRDKRTQKTKGYGFVSFLDPFDAAMALKEMQGAYVGNRPIKLRRSAWNKREHIPKGKGGKRNNHIY